MSDRCQRIRERLQAEYDEALEEGRETKFNPEKPWGSVWEEMAEREGDWWNKHVELAALFVEAKVKTPASDVEGDAPVAHGAHAAASKHTSHHWYTTPREASRGKRQSIWLPRQPQHHKDNRHIWGTMTGFPWVVGKCPRTTSRTCRNAMATSTSRADQN